MSSVASPPKRPMCARCLRALSSCICHWITPLVPTVQVLILQHPLEVHQAKGSARLLHLSLNGSVLISGEQFSEAALRDLLYGASQSTPAQAIQPVLLYPQTPESGAPWSGIQADCAGPSALSELSRVPRVRLVVLDATWRKSRKMLHLNPLLQHLPRLPLIDPPASQYRIRKAHRADQLSTLEASCHALAQLEHDDGKYLPLLQAFDGFVGQQGGYADAAGRKLSDAPA